MEQWIPILFSGLWSVKVITFSLPHLWVLHPQIHLRADWKYSGKKFQKVPKNKTWIFLSTSNYLHIIWINFHSICIVLDTISRRRQWHPTPVLLPGKSHGWRTLVGCSPWSHQESDMTGRLHFHFSLSCIGKGNGNPLQCSCLENPRDGGAWWAAVYGVAQSRTQLKQLSSSSSRYYK